MEKLDSHFYNWLGNKKFDWSITMRKLSLILLIFLISSLLYSTAVYAETAEKIVPDASMVSKTFDQAIQEIIDTNKAKGAAATLVINGEVAMTKGYGYADESQNIKADGNRTGFRIGSVSKTFVALAALIAMEEGKIDMDTEISNYLPEDFPKLKYQVTMKNLLTHTAGFEEQITGMAAKEISDTEPLSVSVRKYKPAQIFKPGDTASYSNYGIALAAYVIENVTGEDFADYCNKKIFQPLGMKSTTYAHMQNTVRVSEAYLPNGKQTMDVYMNLYPEGSAVSTAEDMAKYIQWLLSEDEGVLTKENKEELFTRQYAMADEFGGIGYVWNRKTRNDSIYYDKKGETLHFYSRIALYPDQKAGLFLSFNTYVPEKDIDAVVAKVTNLLSGEKESPVPKAGATIDIRGSYVNTWSSFRTAEKLLRLFIPSKMVEISGSLQEGYTFNGQSMVHLGSNAYDTPIGVVKFSENGGKTLLATDFSQTYVRINFLENKSVTIAVTLLFLISALVNAIVFIIFRIKKKTWSRLSVSASLIQIAAFFVLGILIFTGIMQYAILVNVMYLKIAAWVILAATAINLAYSLTKSFRNCKTSLRYIHLMHNIVGIAFCVNLFIYNLLL